MRGLVLSLFPGADLLGRAFEAEGWCVVRGPDVLLGGDARDFRAIAGRFDGVIGGPPCQSFSNATRGHNARHGDLIPEFERIVLEAEPVWWLMEQVPQAYVPRNLQAWPQVLDAWEYGAAQHRRRLFASNLYLTQHLARERLPVDRRHPDPFPTITATEHKYSPNSSDKRRAGRKVNRRLTLAEVTGLMGLPEDFETPGLLLEAAYAVRGNGVPLPMGRAIARAINAALAEDSDRVNPVEAAG